MANASGSPEAAPIGVFDSGLGGLTVLDELVRRMPHEHFVFLGDSARCPYGPRDPREVKSFVLEICSFLEQYQCKMVVIACNTATAAGLAAAQLALDVPVVGVVEPGARAAVHMTRNRCVGVIATEGTVAQGVYPDAIRHLDVGIQVFQQAAPEFVRIAESMLDADADPAMPAEERFDDVEVAHGYLSAFHELGIDTLVLGCTHYPLIAGLIAQEMDEGVTLVSSAEETAREVHAILTRRGQLSDAGGSVEILVTGDDVEKFKVIGSRVLGWDVPVRRITLQDDERGCIE